MLAGRIGDLLFLSFVSYLLVFVVAATQHIESDAYVEKLTYALVDNISTSGTLTSYQYDRYKKDIANFGDFKITMKFQKSLGNELYDSFYDPKLIIDRKLLIGDRVTIAVEQQNISYFERVINVWVSIMSLGTKYANQRIEALATCMIQKEAKNIVYGYDVIVAIAENQGDTSVDIKVVTRLNSHGKIYKSEAYGDDDDEKLEYGVNHIFEIGEFRYEKVKRPDNTTVLTYTQVDK